MPTIQAYQHIYSNVEKEQSPSGRGGFQTLFYSDGLTQAEVEEMEGRLLYFTSDTEPTKHLFFTTSSGKAAIAQIVPLADTDKYGRGGRYLAHSLVFTAEALAQIQVDPFPVLAQFPFITTVEAALKQGDFERGRIPTAQISLKDKAEGLARAQQWTASQYQKLALLALRAETLAKQRNAITVVGPSPQVVQALSAAFVAVPLSRRRHCTFDSYFYRCNLVATYFWATGLPSAPVTIKFVQVDTGRRLVAGDAPEQPESAYERWAIALIQANRLPDLARRREEAWALASWLEQWEFDSARLEQAPPALISDLFAAAPKAVQGAVTRQAGQQLSSELVERAAGYLFANSESVALYRQLRRGLALPDLLEVLHQSYRAERLAPPSRAEQKALETLLAQQSHPQLSLFLAFWDSPKKALPQALNQVDKESYRAFVDLVLPLELIEPLQLLVPAHAGPFLDRYLSTQEPELAPLAEVLVEQEQAPLLSRLSPLVARQDRRTLGKLSGLINDHHDLPLDFKQAVAQAIAALPPERGVTGLVKRVLRRVIRR